MSFINHTVKTKPRLLTVSESARYYPRITLSGAWLHEWGFSIGDRISLLRIGASALLIRTGTWSESPDLSKYQQRAGTSSPLQIREPPSYCLSTSPRNCPEIIITGAWLCNWGFTIGDRISLTKTKDNHILMKVIMPASEWRQVLWKRKLVREAKFASAMLERHKATHPSLYEEAPEPARKRVATSKSIKRSQPSLFDQIMATTREYNADVAARPANTPVSG